jgi:hypothetical protein
MIRALLRVWQRVELKHVEDAIADELDRERNHARRMRNLQAIRADLMWSIRGGPSAHSGLIAWPRERKS